MRGRTPILAIGALLFVTLTGVSLFDARAQSGSFVGLMLVAGGAYVVALVLVSRGPGSRRLLAACLVLGAMWRVALLASAPLVSDDVYRYVWDGRAQRFGVNPYATAPGDPAVANLSTELTRKIDPTNAELPTIYPPAAQLFFRLVTTVHESVVAMVVAVLLCDGLIVLVLWRWLVAAGRDPWWVIAYAWHPLVALGGAGGGHIDIVGTLLLVTAAYALTRHRTFLATAALALSVAVKFLPVVLAPLFWRRVRLRDVLISLGLVALLYVPFTSLDTGLPLGSLRTYAEQWRFNGPFFAILEPWLGIPVVLALAAGLGVALAAVAGTRLGVSDPAAWAWPIAATLLFLPAVYPWYLVWMTPFLTSPLTWPLVAWTLTAPITYVVWGAEQAGAGWVLPGWVQPLEYGVVAGVGLWVWRRSGPFSRSRAS